MYYKTIHVFYFIIILEYFFNAFSSEFMIIFLLFIVSFHLIFYLILFNFILQEKIKLTTKKLEVFRL